MNREKAKAVARFIQELLIKPQEPLVFVEVLEFEGYLPKVYINRRVTECSIREDLTPNNYSIICRLDTGMAYLLDNPVIHDITGTLHFRNKNTSGQEIFRSFTLMRPYKGRMEQLLWLRWKHALI